jgi:mono/diheme cytochrome c family protein
MTAIGWALVISVFFPAAAGAQPAADTSVVAAGRQVYVRECASCHGAAATGYGPASWVLRERPPDLTRLSDRTVPFPRESLRNGITGRIRLEPGHHASEMPFWRKSLDAMLPAQGVKEIDALLTYLDDIQLRKFGPGEGPSPREMAAAGRLLFQTHCAACHRDGRGLTTIALRNAGAFELRRVYESIARCDDGWARTGMPSWGRSFARSGWGEYLSMKHIEALATYVESLQRTQ